MEALQWLERWNQALAGCNWDDFFRKAERWSKQNDQLWSDLLNLVDQYSVAQVWMTSAMAAAERWQAMVTPCIGSQAFSGSSKEAEQNAVLRKERDEALAVLAEQKKAMTNLKRALTRKETTLSKSKATVDSQRQALAEKDRRIEKLEAQLERYPAEVNERQAAAKKGGQGRPAEAPARQRSASS